MHPLVYELLARQRLREAHSRARDDRLARALRAAARSARADRVTVRAERATVRTDERAAETR
jgi:hypothetical protein